MTDRGLVHVHSEAIAVALDRHDEYRVLRRMRPMRRGRDLGVRPDMHAGCAVVVRTTGSDPNRDRIIELAAQRFWADAQGCVVITGRLHDWVEDPGVPIPVDVTRSTGLGADRVAGRTITDPVAASLIVDADFVVAHGAMAARPFVEARLPETEKRPWVCTREDVDWSCAGFEGRELGHLLAQAGWFHRHSGARADVTALLHLLDHPMHAGRTVLAEAIGSARRTTWRIEATGAPFGAGELLRWRGYRWNELTRTWSREVGADLLDHETEWAALEVYGGMGRPAIREICWRERYAGR